MKTALGTWVLCALCATAGRAVYVEQNYMWFCNIVTASPVYYTYHNKYYSITFDRVYRNKVDVKPEQQTFGHDYLQVTDELFYAIKYDHYVAVLNCQTRPTRKFDYAMSCTTRSSTELYKFNGQPFSIDYSGTYNPGVMEVRGLQRGMYGTTHYEEMSTHRYGLLELSDVFKFYMCDALPVLYQGDTCDPQLNLFNLTKVDLQSYADFKSCPLYLPGAVVVAILTLALALLLILFCCCVCRRRRGDSNATTNELPPIPEGYKIVSHS